MALTKAQALSAGQRWLLEQLALGEKIAYSQDGDSAWLSPSKKRICPADISDRDLHDLRERRLIGSEPFDENELYRFSPCEVITDLGRRAATPSKEG